MGQSNLRVETLVGILDRCSVDYAVFDPRIDVDEISALQRDAHWEIQDADDSYVLFRRSLCPSGQASHVLGR